MKSNFLRIFVLTFFLIIVQCKEKNVESIDNQVSNNQIVYAKGFSLENFNNYSILKINNPWPKATKNYTYILAKKNAIVPDSLRKFTKITIPIQKIVVTSTTHIPSLEMLEVENSLIGFPNLNYISSEKIRTLIDAKKIREIGMEQALNTEVVLDLNPDLIVGFGIDNNNPSYDNLMKSGLKVIYNGDWNEQTVLGKAEWIKFFGALYNQDEKAKKIFNNIIKDYNTSLEIVKNTTIKPSILCGEMYENVWYLPQGNSWSSKLLKDAQTNYLWQETSGTGSLSLPFEKVFEKAKNAEYWFQGSFSSLQEMENSNVYYKQFEAFKNKKVYSFASKKGKTGGVLFYELSGNRPDLVLKDIIKIVHPELLPNYELFFYSKLK